MMKKIVPLFLAIAMVLAISACGSSSESSNTSEVSATEQVSEETTSSDVSEEELDTFVQTVDEFHNKIEDLVIVLENMGDYETNFMNARGKPSDSLLEYTYSWLEKNSDYTEDWVISTHEEVSGLFSTIMADANIDNEIEYAIYETAGSLWSNFSTLYETVTTIPESVDSFTSNFTSSANDVKSEYDTLGSMLEDPEMAPKIALID